MGDEDNVVMNYYCHIGNGGVSFKVLNDERFGAVLEVSASHFGQKTNGMHLNTTASNLEKLGLALIKAAQFSFSGKPYCYALEEDTDGGSPVPEEPKQVKVQAGNVANQGQIADSSILR